MRAACWRKGRRPKSVVGPVPRWAIRRPWRMRSSRLWKRPETRRRRTPMSEHHHNRLTAKMRRVGSLVRKEGRQVLRDPSSVAIGIVLPVLLILLFGYGLSLDVRDVPVPIVMEDSSPRAVELAAGFRLSPYFQVHFTPSMTLARTLME